MIRGNDPILLTPGPLTTSLATKAAMLRDLSLIHISEPTRPY